MCLAPLGASCTPIFGSSYSARSPSPARAAERVPELVLGGTHPIPGVPGWGKVRRHRRGPDSKHWDHFGFWGRGKVVKTSVSYRKGQFPRELGQRPYPAEDSGLAHSDARWMFLSEDDLQDRAALGPRRHWWRPAAFLCTMVTTPSPFSSQSSFMVAGRGCPPKRSSQTPGKVTPADTFFPS